MRRWNGWGDDGVVRHLPASTLAFLRREMGPPPQTPPDADLNNLLDAAPRSTAPAHDLLHTDPRDRLIHSFGQSLPDWVALRYGSIDRLVDAVAFPVDATGVRRLLEFASRNELSVIPYGGGTSVVGHLTPTGDRPVISLDMTWSSGLRHTGLDDLLATFGAGTPGPVIENLLLRQGLTLGHFPQSWEYSTLGGWIATRSSGQESRRYGRIEGMLAGLSLESPAGPLDLPALPASAAGPDLKQLVLGAEGRLGVITEATVRVRRVPECRRYVAFALPSWGGAVDAARVLAQSDLAVSMVRVSDPDETRVTLKLAGRVPGGIADGLGWVRPGSARGVCLLIVGSVGSETSVRQALRGCRSIVLSHRGAPLGAGLGRVWEKGRFSMPYLRNPLWENGYALDTVETALPWSRVAQLREAIRAEVPRALAPFGARPLVFSHLSHVYPDGASLYTTLVWPRSATPEETLATWAAAKAAASTAITRFAGTISHQHGVGTDHKPYLANEKSEVGMTLLKDAVTALDPRAILNPTKLID